MLSNGYFDAAVRLNMLYGLNITTTVFGGHLPAEASLS